MQGGITDNVCSININTIIGVMEVIMQGRGLIKMTNLQPQRTVSALPSGVWSFLASHASWEKVSLEGQTVSVVTPLLRTR